jgi:hypothetical protein
MFGFGVCDLTEGLAQFLQDTDGLYGMCGSQQRGVARTTHTSVLELRLDEILRSFSGLCGHG